MRSGLRIPALALTASLVLAACGGGGGGGGGSPAASGSAKCPSGVHFPASFNDHGAKPMSGNTVALTAGDFFFSPTCTTSVSSSSTVVLRVHNNSGQTLHNVSVPSQGIDQDVVAGQTITVRIKVGSTPLVFFCKYHKTSGMYGALVPSG